MDIIIQGIVLFGSFIFIIFFFTWADSRRKKQRKLHEAYLIAAKIPPGTEILSPDGGLYTYRGIDEELPQFRVRGANEIISFHKLETITEWEVREKS